MLANTNSPAAIALFRQNLGRDLTGLRSNLYHMRTRKYAGLDLGLFTELLSADRAVRRLVSQVRIRRRHAEMDPRV